MDNFTETICLTMATGSIATALIMLGVYLTASDHPAFGNANFNSTLRKRAGIALLSWAFTLFLAFPLLFIKDEPYFDWCNNLETMTEMMIFAPTLIWMNQALFTFDKNTTMGKLFWHNDFAPIFLYIPAFAILVSYTITPGEWQIPVTYIYWGVVGFSFFVKYTIDKIKYQKYLLDNYSTTDTHDMGWVDWVVIIMLVHYVMYILCTQSFLHSSTTNILLYVDLLICVCNAGYLTWSVDHLEKVEEEPVVEEEEIKEQPLEWVQSVLEVRCVQSALYLNPDLTLMMLADRTGINYKMLSRYFSSIGKNYNRYINELRIEHAKKLIVESEGTPNLTNIAEQSGYANVYTFRRVFKEIVGCLPSQYKA